MKNLELWEKVAACPPEALTPITGGRLQGKSDINPMWRYKMLTEIFGPAGRGWGVEDVTYTVLDGADGEKAVMCCLRLWHNTDGEKRYIPGQGGSMLVAWEKSSRATDKDGKKLRVLVTNDEAYKMAYTDAVSVACKQLGFAADVYWANGADSKYQRGTDEDPLGTGNTEKRLPPRAGGSTCEVCGAKLTTAQATLSQNKHNGRLLCPACQQKEAGNG